MHTKCVNNLASGEVVRGQSCFWLVLGCVRGSHLRVSVAMCFSDTAMLKSKISLLGWLKPTLYSHVLLCVFVEHSEGGFLLFYHFLYCAVRGQKH